MMQINNNDMNIEIVRKNIKQVIMHPCFSDPWNKDCKNIKPNGLSDDGEYIMVKTTPNDTLKQINLNHKGEPLDYVLDIINSLPKKYQDKLVTLRHDTLESHYYLPVFDSETQKEWDDEYDSYIRSKMAWCKDYGCD